MEPQLPNRVPQPTQKPQGPWSTIGRSLLTYFGIALLIGAIAFTFFFPQQEGEEIGFSTLIQDVRNEQIQKIEVQGEELTITYKDESVATTRKEASSSLVSLFYEAGIEDVEQKVDIVILDPDPYGLWIGIIVNFLPFLILGALIFMFIRQTQRSSGSIFGFGKSNAKLFRKDMPKISFKDAAGVDEAKQELAEVVDFLKSPKKYQDVGARIPRGVLLVGPAGVGKTLLARAVAGEANVPFYSIAGSEFMEMFVGVGASRVRDLFETAKNSSPAIIFIDEIESIGRHRGAGASSSHGEQEQTLNQILVEMDGFTPNTGVIILAATNRPDLLDPALTRPGRFDRRVMLELPDIEGRKAILSIHSEGKPISDKVSIERLARRTVGFSGADLENMLNEAAIMIAREDRKEITTKDLEETATKVKMGPSREKLQSDEDKKLTAYHEAGHAIAAHYLPKMDPVHRVSIVSRGAALGFTMIPPAEDRYNLTEERIKDNICALMGGRAAEEIFFNEKTVGASNDIERATGMARDMVIKYGMNDELGPRAIPDEEQQVVGSWSMEKPVRYSEELLAKIDSIVGATIKEQYERAKNILQEHRDDVEAVSQRLIAEETIEADEFEEMMGTVTDTSDNSDEQGSQEE
ncbi:ATP-dependent zinc metalloprotease FtsH [candidate division WWE3 bacterium]|uniref:ATP-dependent zinc metalloprotease FtsH n=1 Tax=candidate division WWE3 bacterium TaxID=2053526 RepID=A0A955LW91_UNCKA|nr:ATP-dependent zinc metalloprotease FtsH [candidate division WWE3 bacterium]